MKNIIAYGRDVDRLGFSILLNYLTVHIKWTIYVNYLNLTFGVSGIPDLGYFIK